MCLKRHRTRHRVRRGPSAAHEATLARLTTPGPVENGNELPVDLLWR
jgi:hypothetical protein